MRDVEKVIKDLVLLSVLREDPSVRILYAKEEINYLLNGLMPISREMTEYTDNLNDYDLIARKTFQNTIRMSYDTIVGFYKYYNINYKSSVVDEGVSRGYGKCWRHKMYYIDILDTPDVAANKVFMKLYKDSSNFINNLSTRHIFDEFLEKVIDCVSSKIEKRIKEKKSSSSGVNKNVYEIYYFVHPSHIDISEYIYPEQSDILLRLCFKELGFKNMNIVQMSASSVYIGRFLRERLRSCTIHYFCRNRHIDKNSLCIIANKLVVKLPSVKSELKDWQ